MFQACQIAEVDCSGRDMAPAGIWLDILSSTYFCVTVMQSEITSKKTLFVFVLLIHARLRFINQNAAELRNRANEVLVN